MKKIRFTLICPAAKAFRVHDRNARPSRRMKVFRFSMLGPLYVAASAPEYVETTIVDESVEPVDLDCDADVIGLSFMTFNAPRAYEIADAFRRRGKAVFFGGYHPTLMAQEAIRHCDAVCIGEAEPNVPRMFDDLRRGRLQEFYQAPGERLAPLRVDTGLIHRNQYVSSAVIQATRGCYGKCEFCSVSAFYNHGFKSRPVKEVVAEIESVGSKSILFIDDNMAADVPYAKALFRAMIPLRKHWYAQMGVNVTGDAELLDLMERSGCRGIFVGFESVSQDSLDSAAKGSNRAAYYRTAIAKLHERGIAVFGAFVMGFDTDARDIFARTGAFLREARVDVLQLTMLTPFPGTPLFARMDSEGRIIDRNWEHYDFGHVVIEPKNMSRDELKAGHDMIMTEFYSWRAILLRSMRQLSYLRPKELFYALLLSIGYRYKAGKEGYFLSARSRTTAESLPQVAPALSEAVALPGRGRLKSRVYQE